MIDTDNDVFDIGSEKMMEIPIESVERTVKKHSKNIIDLIEVKDIIKVRNLCGDNITFCFEIYDEKTMMDLKLGLEDKELEILGILTREQFAQAEYKIKEDK